MKPYDTIKCIRRWHKELKSTRYKDEQRSCLIYIKDAAVQLCAAYVSLDGENAALWDALRELKGHDYCVEVVKKEQERQAELRRKETT